MKSSPALIIASVLICIACSTKEEALTVTDYQRAEKMLAVNTSLLVSGIISGQTWLKNDLLFYKTSSIGGWSYVMANPATKEKKSAFDHDKLADALTQLGLKDVKANQLELTQVDISDNDTLMIFNYDGKRYQANMATCEVSQIPSRRGNEHLSPNGKLAAYIKDFNLWVRDTESNKSTQLTFDGKEYYGYATNNAGWTRGEIPVLLWSQLR